MSLSITQSRDDIQIEPPSTKNFIYNILDRILNVCSCFRKRRRHRRENVVPLVHAVDSVRLVYMRRIEEASMLNLRRQSQPDEHIAVQPRIIRHRRVKQEKSIIIALEKALKEYESRHKAIISSTRVPELVPFDKTCNISRSTQTDPLEVINELMKTVGEAHKTSFISVDMRRVVVNHSNDKSTNTDKDENLNTESTMTKKEIPLKIIKSYDVQGDSESTVSSFNSFSVAEHN